MATHASATPPRQTSKTFLIEELTSGSKVRSFRRTRTSTGESAADGLVKVATHASGAAAAVPSVFGLLRGLKQAFLPEGFPSSVSDDYVVYQIWDTVQALCSAVTGVLATKAILQGVGVGDAQATALGATLSWIFRDGTGMVGRIIFSWYQGTRLDSNAKTWRLMADVINDCALFLEFISPSFPDYFLLLACTANVAKSIVGVAGGVTRTVITNHQARNNNVADVAAKDGSQETAVSLVGMLLGMAVVMVVTASPNTTFLIFAAAVAMHLFANYKAVTAVVFETLNEQRTGIVFRDMHAKGPSADSDILTPALVALQERPIWFDTDRPNIRLGVPVVDAVADTNALLGLVEMYRREHYILTLTAYGSVRVILHKRGEAMDTLKAFFHALVVRTAFKEAKAGTAVDDRRDSDDGPEADRRRFSAMRTSAEWKALALLMARQPQRGSPETDEHTSWRARVVEASKAVADAYFPQLWGDMGAAGWSRKVMHFVLEDTRCDW